MTTEQPFNLPITFRPRKGMGQDIAVRWDRTGWPGGTARRDLERYYEALRRGLNSVSLTEEEALAIVDACNGTLWSPHSVPFLWAEVADAIRLGGLATKWQLDGPTLVSKLQSLHYCQCLAIVDAAERWWLLPPEQHNRDGLIAVGLLPAGHEQPERA